MVARVLGIIVCAFALVLGAAVPRAAAQEPAAAEALLADMGAWMVEYYAVAQSSPLDIDGYIAVFDAYGAGQANRTEATAALLAWRDRALALNADAQRRANALRAPPDMTAGLGAQGASLDVLMRATQEGLTALLANQRTLIGNLATYGLEAISDPSKISEARTRAVIEAQIQLLESGERRLNISVAVLHAEHPNHGVFSAALLFYAGLKAIANNELAALDGRGDSVALAATLRASARGMRGDLARAEAAAVRVRDAARWQHTPDTERMAAMMVRMAETYPELAGQYRLLADAMDRAAGRIEAGEEVGEAWALLEEEAEAPLQEIARLDRERAAMVGAPPTH